MDYNVPIKVGTGFSLQKIPSLLSRHALKIIVTMKIIALLFLFNLQVTASVYSQRISLTASNTPLRDVLQSIRKQSGYSFFVESDNLRDSKPVNLDLQETSITAALEKVFENQPFSYTIENKVIVVTRKRDNLSATDFLTFNNGGPDSLKVVHIQGMVKDDKGQPLVGVSIRVKGGGTGTVTNVDGNYNLKTNAAATLIFSYIGYLTKEIKASQGEVDVVLQQLNTALDQVQVIAYGTTTKRLSTGNQITINAETIERQPVSNPLLALQGRTPGVFIKQTTGLSAGNVNINVQGINSLTQGTAPFFVIDGVPYTPKNLLPTLMGTGITGGGGGSTLGYINPNDIESITILKDADATSIYGSRAANGAIIITTKKGKAGNTKVDLDLQTGWSTVPKQTKMLNTSDYIALRKEGKKNDNAPILPSDYDINGVWDTTRNTNWQKELIGGTASFTNLQGSISGGGLNTQFLVSGGYLKETTVFPGDLADTKANVHANISHISENQKFKYGLTITYLQDKNNMATSDLSSYAFSLPPDAPALYNSDGSLNWGLIPGTSSYSFVNPLSYLKRQYKGTSNNLIGNSSIGYTIIPGLEIRTSLGYNRLQSDETTIIPQSSYDPSATFNGRMSNAANKSITSWIIEPQIEYRKALKFGQFNFLLGSTVNEIKSYALAISGSGFANDAQLMNLQAAPVLSISSALQSDYRYCAFFGRFNYIYNNKYILTLAARRDGSSRFGSVNRFANFYSIAGAWVFSEENIVKNMLPKLSYGKLRVSYGTTGNDQIGDYKYLTLYNSVTTNIPYQQTVGLAPTGHANPYLQWELTKKLNFGLDLGFLNNRILLTANYYYNTSNNQLISYPLGYITGFPLINKNINATIKNTGVELQLEATPVKNQSFNWSTSINFTVAKNKLTRFDDLATSTLAASYMIGQPVNIALVYPFLGVNPATGFYQYLSKDGKATSDPNYNTDRVKPINLNPKWFGGFSNTLTYKNISLDLMFQFMNLTNTSDKMTFLGIPGSSVGTPALIADRWHNPGDQAQYQKATLNQRTAYNALLYSEARYADASYLRLKNVSLSYKLPKNWTRKVKISSATIFVNGQNIFTITNFYGPDPETGTFSTLPPLRTVTIGGHISF
ncbi:SusC/RagA family TonB-linked outer membrane protein [Chitinophaga sp. HK235]|uniref:SusC/RagA family TonB-linked outer membrane protein n=1 Tax=Chitinophaga sp. HK235 TaxID=2952571 RepID=UPI001BA47A1D|nr:SusC/RagA family TonB-linked outer membrane protein [Chitinophaga sp. HK235]